MARKRKEAKAATEETEDNGEENEASHVEMEYPVESIAQDPLNFKPGQRYPTPSPGTGDRVFYESLYHQKPTSKMARDYCIAYGVLPREIAEQIFDGTEPSLSQSKMRKEEPVSDKKVKKQSKAKPKAKGRKRKRRNDSDASSSSSSSEDESSSSDDS